MVVHLIPIGKFMIDLTENMKRLLDTYQEIRPDNFSFDQLCAKIILRCHQLYFNSLLDYNHFSANVLYDYNCKYMYIKMKCFLS